MTWFPWRYMDSAQLQEASDLRIPLSAVLNCGGPEELQTLIDAERIARATADDERDRERDREYEREFDESYVSPQEGWER